MGKCRDALAEEGGDIEKAVEWLRRRGVRSMEKRTSEATEGLLALGFSEDASRAAIVELRAETDFVTKGELFQQIALALAQTAAERSGSSLDAVGLKEAPLLQSPVPQIAAGTAVSQALLEMGSVLGERLALGDVWHLASPSGGVIAGYAHPRQPDALPGTGRMAALVAIQPSSASGDLSAAGGPLHELTKRLARHAVAAQPRFLSVESIPTDVAEKENETMKAAHLAQLGPEKAKKLDDKVLAKVLDGKRRRFHQEAVFLSQEFVAPQDAGTWTVEKWLKQEAKSIDLEAIELQDFRLACI